MSFDPITYTYLKAFKKSRPLIKKPEITNLSGGETGVTPTFNIQGTSFSSLYGGETRDHRKVQIFQIPGSFESPDYDEQISSDSYTPSPQLNDTAVFQIRIKDVSIDENKSKWSDIIEFATASVFIQQPTITVTGSPDDVPEDPQLITSSFSVFGDTDTHEYTEWRVVRNADSSIIWETSSYSNLTEITVPRDTLSENVEYLFEARFYGTTYGYSEWGSTFAMTTDVFTYVANPTLTVTGSPSSVPESPDLSGSSFQVQNGTDSHFCTEVEVLDMSDTVVWSNSLESGVIIPPDFTSLSEGSTIGETPLVQFSSFDPVPAGSDTHIETEFEILDESETLVWNTTL